MHADAGVRIALPLARLCYSGVACEWCRRKEEAREWRAGLWPHYVVPDPSDPDWACPEGKPWGYRHPEPPRWNRAWVPPPELRGGVPIGRWEREAPRREAPEMVNHRQTICDECDQSTWIEGRLACKLIGRTHQHGGRTRHLPSCCALQRMWADPQAHCPHPDGDKWAAVVV